MTLLITASDTILLNRATLIEPNFSQPCPISDRTIQGRNLRAISTKPPPLLPSILLQPTRAYIGALWVADGFGFLQPSRKKYCRNITHHGFLLYGMNMEETQISGTPGLVDLRSWYEHTVHQAALLVLM